MNRIYYLIFIGFFTDCNSNPGKRPEEKIDYVVNKAFQDGDFVGSVLVANKGNIIYRKHFGMANADSQIPISDSTKFLIASVSKPITAILILQLVEHGKIKLDDSLSNFFNIKNNPQASKVTIHHLLTHTSGIEELINENHEFGENDIELANFNFDPGSDFEYSSTGYVLLKEIAERKSKKNFEELIEQQICKLAQMNSSGVARDPHQISNLAVGYKTTNQVDPVEIGYSLKIVDGAGSLYSTADDLFKLDRSLYSDELLSRKSMDLMQSQHVEERFGYGWFLRERSGTWDVMYHEGDLPGHTSYFSRHTQNDEVIILLSNSEGLDLSNLENDISKILKFDN